VVEPRPPAAHGQGDNGRGGGRASRLKRDSPLRDEWGARQPRAHRSLTRASRRSASPSLSVRVIVVIIVVIFVKVVV
jgi:hypothetical protein